MNNKRENIDSLIARRSSLLSSAYYENRIRIGFMLNATRTKIQIMKTQDWARGGRTAGMLMEDAKSMG